MIDPKPELPFLVLISSPVVAVLLNTVPVFLSVLPFPISLVLVSNANRLSVNRQERVVMQSCAQGRTVK
jgi:hypothetical protein